MMIPFFPLTPGPICRTTPSHNTRCTSLQAQGEQREAPLSMPFCSGQFFGEDPAHDSRLHHPITIAQSRYREQTCSSQVRLKDPAPENHLLLPTSSLQTPLSQATANESYLVLRFDDGMMHPLQPGRQVTITDKHRPAGSNLVSSPTDTANRQPCFLVSHGSQLGRELGFITIEHHSHEQPCCLVCKIKRHSTLAGGLPQRDRSTSCKPRTDPAASRCRRKETNTCKMSFPDRRVMKE
ncbi:hypothetical protein LY76DRAFT_226324 [Colletotrichum caudatum]|nr:hypothetical protein LY76DRAFT_226324 [Colletotrichum caudatum]